MPLWSPTIAALDGHFHGWFFFDLRSGSPGDCSAVQIRYTRSTMEEASIRTLYVVSDGRGETCSQVVNAALVQFEGQPYNVIRRANIRAAAEVREIVQEAAAAKAVVFYTLVCDECRDVMKEAAKNHLVPTVDILGPIFSGLRDLFGVSPRSEPGLLYNANRDRFDRLSAIEYTLNHDDGQRQDELADAHVVLVGVSRASKTSTCFFLAYDGIRAANVPLVPGLQPTYQLLGVDPKKVIGLRVNVMRLKTLREARADTMGSNWLDTYLDSRAIAREVNEANRLMDSRGWRSIDASYKAVEEVAKEVKSMVGIAGLKRG